MVIQPGHLRCALAASAGAALSTAHPIGIAASIAMPALALSQETRCGSYTAALSYYAAALWPLIPAARNFFGPDVSAATAVAFWVIASALLALPWMLVWSPDRLQARWRGLIGLALTVVPPLGIIGWASPLTAAGILFPGSSWPGLLLCAVSGGALATRPWRAAVMLAAVSVICNFLSPPGDSRSLPEWRAVDTAFGAIGHGAADPLAAYEAAEWIQREALSSNAKVTVFPETVVPAWTASTDAFWRLTLDRLRAGGKTILVGALVPVPSRKARPARYDFSADLAALTGMRPPILPAVTSQTRSKKREPAFAYDNTLVLRGAESGSFRQRIPVPIAMWNPLRTEAARLNVTGPGIIRLRGERVAVLICYEQLLAWPAIASMVERPTVVIAVANDHWLAGTPIPRFQLAAVRAWARLFRLPYLSAVNL